MKLTPVPSPEVRQEVQAQLSRQSAQSARERAIAAVQANGQPAAVDANNVSPEEVTAVTSSKPGTPTSGDAASQTVTSEAQAAKDSEQVPVDTKPAPERPKDESLTNQYNILARKERALRAKQQAADQAMRTREAALAAKEAELAAKDKQYSTEYIPKQRLKQETLNVLAEEGLSYDELTQQILNQSPANPQVDAHIKRLEAKIQQMEAKAEESQKNYVTAEQERYKAAVKQISSDVASLVKTDPTFETIRATRSTKDVVDLIEQTFKETGNVLSVEDACTEVENYLVSEALKLTRIEKIRKELAKAQPAATAQASQKTLQTKQTQPMKTLTNATDTTRQLSARERALLAFKGELKA